MKEKVDERKIIEIYRALQSNLKGIFQKGSLRFPGFYFSPDLLFYNNIAYPFCDDSAEYFSGS